MKSPRRSKQAQEASARLREVQAAIARRLKDDYDLTAPIPNRIAELLRLLAKRTGEIDEQESIPCAAPRRRLVVRYLPRAAT